MAAGINDKFKKVSADNSYAVATTVKTARTVGGGTTLEAFDLSKWADATAVNFLTYRKTTDPVTNITTVTNRTGWTALVNTGSNTLTNLTIAPGYTDLGQQVGDYIEPVQMSKWANDLVDGILVSHNQDGSLKNNAVSTAKIGDNQVTTAKIADSSVTAGKIDSASFVWSSWVPTWSGLSVGNAVVSAKYTVVGKLVLAKINIDFGTTTAVSGDIGFTNPVPAAIDAGTGNITPRGTALAFSGSEIFPATVGNTSPTVSNLRFHKGGSPYVTLLTAPGSGVPFTWSSSSEIGISFSYEAA